MDPRRKSAFYLLCCLLLGASGCAALVAGTAGAGVGVGAYSYIEGNLKRDYQAPLTRVWQATLTALAELDLKTETKERDAFGGLIKGELFDGSRVTIKLERKADTLTLVAVRVGLFGNQEQSRYIHDMIAEKLSRG